jgi:hypothetical protein
LIVAAGSLGVSHIMAAWRSRPAGNAAGACAKRKVEREMPESGHRPDFGLDFLLLYDIAERFRYRQRTALPLN